MAFGYRRNDGRPVQGMHEQLSNAQAGLNNAVQDIKPTPPALPAPLPTRDYPSLIPNEDLPPVAVSAAEPPAQSVAMPSPAPEKQAEADKYVPRNFVQELRQAETRRQRAQAKAQQAAVAQQQEIRDAALEAQQADAEAADAMESMRARYLESFEKSRAAVQGLQQQYEKLGAVDPTRVFNDVGTQVMMGIAALANGFASGLSGTPNKTAEMIDRIVKDDVTKQLAERKSLEKAISLNREEMDYMRSMGATEMDMLNAHAIKAKAAAVGYLNAMKAEAPEAMRARLDAVEQTVRQDNILQAAALEKSLGEKGVSVREQLAAMQLQRGLDKDAREVAKTNRDLISNPESLNFGTVQLVQKQPFPSAPERKEFDKTVRGLKTADRMLGQLDELYRDSNFMERGFGGFGIQTKFERIRKQLENHRIMVQKEDANLGAALTAIERQLLDIAEGGIQEIMNPQIVLDRIAQLRKDLTFQALGPYLYLFDNVDVSPSARFDKSAELAPQ